MKYLIYSLLVLISIIGCKEDDIPYLSSPYELFDIEDALVQGTGAHIEKIKNLYSETGTIAAYDFDHGLAFYSGPYDAHSAIKYTVAEEGNVGEIIDFYNSLMFYFESDTRSKFSKKYLIIVDTITYTGFIDDEFPHGKYYYDQQWVRNKGYGRLYLGGAGKNDKGLFLDAPTLEEIFAEGQMIVNKRPRRLIRYEVINDIIADVHTAEGTNGSNMPQEFIEAFGKMDHLVYNTLTTNTQRGDYLKNILGYNSNLTPGSLTDYYNVNSDGITLKNSEFKEGYLENSMFLYYAAAHHKRIINERLCGCGLEWTRNHHKDQPGVLAQIEMYFDIYKSKGINLEKLTSEGALKFSTDTP